MYLKHSVQRFGSTVNCALRLWIDDDASTLGAALAFYCAFSLAPLLVILLTVASWFVGAEIAYGQLNSQLTSLFGPATASVLLHAMQSSRQAAGWWATTLSIGSLLIGATTVFSALEAALERIWGLQAEVASGMRGWLRSRLLSFGLILAIAFLLLVSLTLATALNALRTFVLHRFDQLQIMVVFIDFAIGIALSTSIIALIYRYMPAKPSAWPAAIKGAFITALLFQLGRWVIAKYLAAATQPSAFGAAASFVALLLWLYYSAQIFLFGAEVTVCLSGLRSVLPQRIRSNNT